MAMGRLQRWVPWLLCLLTAGTYWLLLLRPELGRLDTGVRREQWLRQDLEQRQRLAANRSVYREHYDSMAKTERELVEAMPDHLELPAMAAAVSVLARANAVELLATRPRPMVTRELYAEQPMRVEARGDYPNLVGFLYDLTRFPQGLGRPGDFLLSAREGTQRLDLEVDYRWYRYLGANHE